jgi:hypothetical protein
MEEHLLHPDKTILLQSILAGYEEELEDIFPQGSFSPIRQARRVLLFRKLGESPLLTNARKIKMLWMTEGEVPCLDEGYEFVEIKLERGTSCIVYQVGEDTFFFTPDKVL